MPADISAGIPYLGGVWAEGVLYGTYLLPSGFLLLISWYRFLGIQWVWSPTNIPTDRWTLSLLQVSSYSSHYATFSPAVRTLGEEKDHHSKSIHLHCHSHLQSIQLQNPSCICYDHVHPLHHTRRSRSLRASPRIRIWRRVNARRFGCVL